jgi:hypothetical protein
MKIAGEYSFNGGKEFIETNYPSLLAEVKTVISNVNAQRCKTKESKELTMPGKVLFSPPMLNGEFDKYFAAYHWRKLRVQCKYPTKYYTIDYKPKNLNKNAYREMDFLKEKLGVEVQFGKYSFMVYNVCAKMTIFKNLGHINAGIEIVPIKKLAEEMSTGVSYFEQFVWDLEARGVSNIDIPVLIFGVDD